MTFAQARAISKTNKLHVRRSTWATDKWFMLWRGTWFVFGAGLLQPVRATDYSAADLLANDWTTVPAALAACPITPTEPTGGGDPSPGTPGFPDDPTVFPTPPGSPGVGGSSSSSLPTPDPGAHRKTLTVTFAGIHHDGDIPDGYFDIEDSDLNGPFTLSPAGAGRWHKIFRKGFFSEDGGHTPDHWFKWTILVTNRGPQHAPDDTRDYFEVRFYSEGVPAGTFALPGGFSEQDIGPAGEPIDNITYHAGDFFYGGTATISIS